MFKMYHNIKIIHFHQLTTVRVNFTSHISTEIIPDHHNESAYNHMSVNLNT